LNFQGSNRWICELYVLIDDVIIKIFELQLKTSTHLINLELHLTDKAFQIHCCIRIKNFTNRVSNIKAFWERSCFIQNSIGVILKVKFKIYRWLRESDKFWLNCIKIIENKYIKKGINLIGNIFEQLNVILEGKLHISILLYDLAHITLDISLDRPESREWTWL
jgi:hypothetical protein